MRLIRAAAALCAATMTAGSLVGAAPAAHGATFPVNPGPIAEGRPIVGTGQNLPPIAEQTYNVGGYLAPQVKAYYESRSVVRDRLGVTRATWRWVRNWTRDHCGVTPREVRACRATVVFDIDETLLNSYSYAIAQKPQFTFDPATWNQYVADCGYSVITQVRALYNRLMRHGVPISLVSAGPESNKAAVSRCLRARGITGWDSLIMLTKDEAGLSVGEFKADARKRLQQDDLRIVASVGDQVSDMAYGHLKRGLLLPNVMYYLH